MEQVITELSLLFVIIIAACLGGVIGAEREIDGHSAGLRTHMFISATAAALISIGSAYLSTFAHQNNVIVSADPFRIIDAIIVGVSFIGGGVILKDERHNQVKNLTTAASLLFTTVIGMCVGAHYFLLAIGLTILALIINFLMLKVTIFINPLSKAEQDS
jgi:putative Mg2+ transporter-C (MgtC) family protein